MPPDEPALVERERDVESLVAALTGAPSVVVVEGEPGVGKSRLVREALGHRALAARQSLVGAARPTLAPCPLGPVIEALATMRRPPVGRLSALSGVLRAVLPDLADFLPPAPPALVHPQLMRHRLVRATAELLSKVGPSVLVIEDLQWADETTLELLRMLGTRPPTATSIVLTCRSLAALPSAGPFSAHLRLRPLSTEGAARLATAVLGEEQVRLPASVAAALYERNGGVPRVVRDDVLLLRQRGRLRPAGDRWVLDPDDGLVPPTVGVEIVRRVRGMDASATAVVEAAAVLADLAEPEIVGRVARSDSAQTARGVAEAVRRGLLRDQEPDQRILRFRHEIARMAVYQAIPGHRRRRLHTAAARALAETGRLPLAVRAVEHDKKSGDRERWAAATETTARAAADAGSYGIAHALLRELLDAGAVADDRRAELAVRLGWAALWRAEPPLTEPDAAAAPVSERDTPARDAAPRPAGTRPAAAGDAGAGPSGTRGTAASATVPPAVPTTGAAETTGSARGPTAGAAAGAATASARATAALLAEAEHGRHVTAAQRAELRLLRLWSSLASARADTDASRALAPLPAHLAGRPDLQAIAHALMAAPDRFPERDAAAQAADLDRARAALARTSDPMARAVVATATAHLLLATADPKGWTAVEALPAAADRPDVAAQVVRGLLACAEAASHLGHYRRSVELVERARRLAAEVPAPEGIDARLYVTEARARWTMGDVDEIDGGRAPSGGAGEGDPPTPGRPAPASLSAALFAAAVRAGQGRLAAARRSLRTVVEDACRIGDLAIAAHAAAEFNRVALTVSDRRHGHALASRVLGALERKRIWHWAAPLLPFAPLDVVRAVLPRFRDALAGRDTPLARAALAFAEARRREQEGEGDAAGAAYRRARRAYAALPDPRMAAHACAAEARALLTAGRAPDADQLRHAWRTLTRLGATWDANRLKQLMRTAGLSIPHRRGRPGYGNQLSPREREIADLAASGHTNRDIAASLYLSDRTVKFHLANAMRKLEVSSRRQLRDVLHPAGPVGTIGDHTCRCEQCGRELNPS